MKLKSIKINPSLTPAGKNNYNGFTILEVMVALAIVGISIGIFFSLIGNSSKLRSKIDDHTRLLMLARTKTEEAFLGVLGKNHTKLNEKKTFEGVTKDGIQWKVTQTDKHAEAQGKINTDTTNLDKNTEKLPPKGIVQLVTQVEAIEINTVFLSNESEKDEKEE